MTDIGAAATPASRARGRRREAARFWWIMDIVAAFALRGYADADAG
jgi:hypothetical protein